jgi:hypothetical protein
MYIMQQAQKNWSGTQPVQQYNQGTHLLGQLIAPWQLLRLITS